MKYAGRYIAVGVAAFFLILVFTLPAVQLERYVEKQVPGLSLSGVSGSVFSGEAGRVVFDYAVLAPLHWRFRPLALLTGRVEYDLAFSTAAGPGKASAGISLAGNAFARDIDFVLPANDIINQYSPVAVGSTGEIRLQVETVAMKDGFPGALAGKAVWRDAAILSPVEMVFGDTQMDLQRVGSELVGNVKNEGDFGLSGEIAVAPGGRYRVELLLSPGPGASRDAIALLESTTTAQAGGNFLLRTSGQW